MGLLAPLYALAAAAVIGPLVFHLIRRQPRGQTEFSSLMFLEPSPPRLTRRSRVEHWLLLLLRMLAIVLIAFAFARPYLRQENFLTTALDSRQVVVLLDTSASMRRRDVWEKARAEAQRVLDALGPTDRVSLYVLDDRWTAVVPVDAQQRLDPRAQQQAVREALIGLKPGWRSTHLADGLMATADTLNTVALGDTDASIQRQIVLITDLHENCGLEKLQGYPWPEGIVVDVRRVDADHPGNARPSLVKADADDDRPRVRIENNSDSVQHNFEVFWAKGGVPIPGAGTAVQVPPGMVHVVPLPARPANADSVVLQGDPWEDDNVEYFFVSPPRQTDVLVVGKPTSRHEDDMVFFLARAPLDTPRVARQVRPIGADELPRVLAGAPAVQSVIVEPTPGSEQHGIRLLEMARGGGVVIVVLAHPPEAFDAVASLLQTLLDAESVRVREADVDDFALVGAIDYQHPVFQPFADPRFNDFSKIRIWNYRRLEITGAETTKVVAGLDSGDPWIIHRPVGRGHVWVMTCGPQPTSSTFGLSSKFVPILLGMLDPERRARKIKRTIEVGQPLELSVVLPAPQVTSPDPADDLDHRWDDVRIVDAEGREVADEIARRVGGAVVFERPGMFKITWGGNVHWQAVVVPFSESHLTPLDPDVLEQYGVQVRRMQSDEQRRESARQLQITELEQRQKIWRWLIVAGLGVLGIETVLAGWFARSARASVTTAGS